MSDLMENTRERKSPQTILSAPYVLPIAPENNVLRDAGIVIEDTTIIAVDDAPALQKRYPQATRKHLPGHVLLPGLVNVHGHLAMTLLRGLGESEPLERWLRNTIWPLENRFVSPSFVADGTELAVAEMIAVGTTTASDMYYFPDQTAEACRRAGFRAQIAFPLFDGANSYSTGFDDCLHKGIELYDNARGDERIQVVFGPHAVYTVGEDSLRRVAAMANEMGTWVHIHLHETREEVESTRRDTGRSPIELLDDCGLLAENLQAVHVTQLTAQEITLLAERGVKVAHCPQSNMKLASGLCPLPELIKAGIVVGLGTDGAVSNNSLDLFETARLAAILAKAVSGNAETLPAADALAMATLGGARALGLAQRIGSLEVGKQADVIAVDVEHAAMQPLYDAHAQLVHTAAGAHVTHTYIDGNLVYENGAYHTLDIERVLHNAARWRDRIAG